MPADSEAHFGSPVVCSQFSPSLHSSPPGLPSSPGLTPTQSHDPVSTVSPVQEKLSTTSCQKSNHPSWDVHEASSGFLEMFDGSLIRALQKPQTLTRPS